MIVTQVDKEQFGLPERAAARGGGRRGAQVHGSVPCRRARHQESPCLAPMPDDMILRCSSSDVEMVGEMAEQAYLCDIYILHRPIGLIDVYILI